MDDTEKLFYLHNSIVDYPWEKHGLKIIKFPGNRISKKPNHPLVEKVIFEKISKYKENHPR